MAEDSGYAGVFVVVVVLFFGPAFALVFDLAFVFAYPGFFVLPGQQYPLLKASGYEQEAAEALLAVLVFAAAVRALLELDALAAELVSVFCLLIMHYSKFPASAYELPHLY